MLSPSLSLKLVGKSNGKKKEDNLGRCCILQYYYAFKLNT